ncbi:MULTISPECIES: glutaredoxin family protein [unclassified Arsukibacterium]|uniref:glutaredoxin family protein n=1 Tax=unclassified Arsukibacterium TaxID=2635278 RepID=UPI000C675E52|nr:MULTISPECIES: glutaredoxin family protein [unclassified Arsukibacterium]MAA93904.1 NrdH-redoxin [Rheinheimera sp.]MBM33355.1 NrdH-redoxin [Rheinheimera sp.]HAW91334.1 NrdH-redoxin [Candidatus Azambacteria bacterium]|tara:strand:+ start:788 stop:1012 length:225 start_codon:yes stop_codon:yes gene_type:complete
MAQYTLYSTWGCHLCQQAETLLVAAELDFQVIDIIDDEQLLQQFRVHIPVLAAGDKLLYWPFDAESIASWLQSV